MTALHPNAPAARRLLLQMLALTAGTWGLGGPIALAQAAGSSPAAEPLQQLRIGYQKSAANLVIVKQSGWLEKRFPQHQDRLDRISRRTAVARSAVGRQPGVRPHRRFAAGLRAGSRQGPRLRRRRAAQARQLGRAGAQGFAAQDAAGAQGPQGGAAERFERALPAGACGREGRPAMERHPAHLPRAGRCARRLRARKRRCLGDLGSVLCGDRTRDPAACAGHRARPFEQQLVLPRFACARRAASDGDRRALRRADARGSAGAAGSAGRHQAHRGFQRARRGRREPVSPAPTAFAGRPDPACDDSRPAARRGCLSQAGAHSQARGSRPHRLATPMPPNLEST